MDLNREKKILCEMHAAGLISEKEFLDRTKQIEMHEESSRQFFLKEISKMQKKAQKPSNIIDEKSEKFASIFTKTI